MYNIFKSRMAAIGLKNVDIIKIINQRYNEHLIPPTFSAALTASHKTPRQEKICDWAEEILTEKEKEQKQ